MGKDKDSADPIDWPCSSANTDVFAYARGGARYVRKELAVARSHTGAVTVSIPRARLQPDLHHCSDSQVDNCYCKLLCYFVSLYISKIPETLIEN